MDVGGGLPEIYRRERQAREQAQAYSVAESNRVRIEELEACVRRLEKPAISKFGYERLGEADLLWWEKEGLDSDPTKGEHNE
ncbi:hypothetical protein LCGC14_1374070 [marine sediment metagenome]|uniref:Uncharacterized protein n=1 Tax=marine sediment metagenome TaxID=412755 RepID=A0A0F9K4K2_9ZZZZ